MASLPPEPRRRVLRARLVQVGMAGCILAGPSAIAQSPMVEPARTILADPYLAEPMDGSLSLSPPPPAPGSAAEGRDREGMRAAVALRGSARWDLATRDAALRDGAALRAFSCAAGVALDPGTMPRLARLIGRATADFGRSTAALKARYGRPRPFMLNGEPMCTPEAEAALRRDGSYPSGHAAIGLGLALVLAELKPERTAALVARGRAFGDSRRICNVHWLSDVEEGRIAAAATFARLQADKAFARDLKASRREMSRAAMPPAGCAAEAAALAPAP